jgi:hypothetical protein
VDANSFEFKLSVPRDAEVAAVVRMMAEQAARYCGCPGPTAQVFGGKVEEAVRAHLNGASAAGSIAVVVRRSTGPLEVLVETRTIALDL